MSKQLTVGSNICILFGKTRNRVGGEYIQTNSLLLFSGSVSRVFCFFRHSVSRMFLCGSLSGHLLSFSFGYEDATSRSYLYWMLRSETFLTHCFLLSHANGPTSPGPGKGPGPSENLRKQPKLSVDQIESGAIGRNRAANVLLFLLVSSLCDYNCF